MRAVDEVLGTGTKRCSNCGEDKPLSEFYVVRAKNNRPYSWCIPCVSAKNKERYAKNKEAICAKVHAYYIANREAALIRQRQYWATTSERQGAVKRAAYANDPGFHRARSRKWSNEHKEQKAEADRKYAKAHPEIRRAARKRWEEAHPEALVLQKRHKEARRRARYSGTERSLTVEEWRRLLAAFDNRCAYCGAENVALAQDHVVPLSAGGPYSITNIVPACKSCNSHKGAMPLSEWAGEEKAKEIYTVLSALCGEEQDEK